MYLFCIITSCVMELNKVQTGGAFLISRVSDIASVVLKRSLPTQGCCKNEQGFLFKINQYNFFLVYLHCLTAQILKLI